MSKPASEKLTDLLNDTGVRIVHYEELRMMLERLRDELRKDEVEAHRSLQADDELQGVIGCLIKKSNPLTGRKENESH